MRQTTILIISLLCAISFFGAAGQEKMPGLALIPAGRFEMGDHYGYRDEKHESHEVPIHLVYVDAFYIGINDVTTKQYCEFLNSALAQKSIEIRNGGVYLLGGQDLLCDTGEMSPYSRIGWNGKQFTVLDQKEDHPMVCVRWHGAAAYCNWLSGQTPSALVPWRSGPESRGRPSRRWRRRPRNPACGSSTSTCARRSTPAW